MFWYTASAVPRYQLSLTRFIGGSISMNSPSSRATTEPQPSRIWRFSESALYCVRMYTLRRSELMQLESVTSMMRYTPPKVTAGLARSRVSGYRRSPAPPANSTPSVSFMARPADSEDQKTSSATSHAQNLTMLARRTGMVRAGTSHHVSETLASREPEARS